MTVQQPSVGRIVHYNSLNRSGDPVVFAALVTEVPELLSDGPNSGPDGYTKSVTLAVFPGMGLNFVSDVDYSETNEAGSWSWPVAPKVEADRPLPWIGHES